MAEVGFTNWYGQVAFIHSFNASKAHRHSKQIVR